MKAQLRFLLIYFAGWLLFFEAGRCLFLGYHHTQAKNLQWPVILESLGYGLRMDAAVAAYFTVPVLLFLLLSLLFRFFRRPVLYTVYTSILLLLCWLAICADLELFFAWGFRIDATPLRYLKSPREAWASISHLPLFWIALTFSITYAGWLILFRWIIRTFLSKTKMLQRNYITAAGLICVALLLIVPMRGGFQQVPLNQSSVYFSSSDFANQSAINPAWSMLQSLLNETSATKNPYSYFTATRARNIVDSLFVHSSTTRRVLRTTTPNIILIIWESFTEKALHVEIDGNAVVPHFLNLEREGLYFSHVYASGNRTDKGVPAILSGYPALNKTSVLHTPGKLFQMPMLSTSFKQRGYHMPFYYGGEAEFANLKSYLLHGGFDPLVDKHAFNKKDCNSKWGAHDGVVAQRLLADLTKMPKPFFAGWLTLSSHEPYEIPVPPAFAGHDFSTQFLNSLHYTDAVLAQFIDSCKQQSWWSQTLVVIVGDHGHPLPETGHTADNFKIPMLWLGGALLETGVVDNVISQTDIAATLAVQTAQPAQSFSFSRNVFDSAYQPWAFFTYSSGFGLAQPGKVLLFDDISKTVIEQEGTISTADINAGKALQQQVWDDYLHK